jgi:hypothetical protein
MSEMKQRFTRERKENFFIPIYSQEQFENEMLYSSYEEVGSNITININGCDFELKYMLNVEFMGDSSKELWLIIEDVCAVKLRRLHELEAGMISIKGYEFDYQYNYPDCVITFEDVKTRIRKQIISDVEIYTLLAEKYSERNQNRTLIQDDKRI